MPWGCILNFEGEVIVSNVLECEVMEYYESSMQWIWVVE